MRAKVTRQVLENFVVVVALIIAIAAALLVTHLLPTTAPRGENWLGGIVAALILWFVGSYFRPSEVRKFASRKSVVAGGSVFLYFSLCRISRKLEAYNSLLGEFVLSAVSIILAYLSYRWILVAIRNFQNRNKPQR